MFKVNRPHFSDSEEKSELLVLNLCNLFAKFHDKNFWFLQKRLPEVDLQTEKILNESNSGNLDFTY